MPSRTARRSGSKGIVGEMSISARAAVVTGMPSKRTTWSGRRVRWTMMPGMIRVWLVHTVTSGNQCSSQWKSFHLTPGRAMAEDPAGRLDGREEPGVEGERGVAERIDARVDAVQEATAHA